MVAMGRSRIVGWIDQTFYSNYEDKWDEHLFRKEIPSHLDGSQMVLDLGAGPGNPLMNLQGKAAKVRSVDADPCVLTNPFLDEAKIGTGEAIPYPDNVFDIVISNNVLEHLVNPQQVFKEVNRVLKLCGFFLAKTPNRRHYVALMGLMTPYWFHGLHNSLRGIARDDVFPTFYRANTTSHSRVLARQSKFKVISLALVEGHPEHLRLFWPAYLIGLAYERVVSALELLSAFRTVIAIQMQKEGCLD